MGHITTDVFRYDGICTAVMLFTVLYIVVCLAVKCLSRRVFHWRSFTNADTLMSLVILSDKACSLALNLNSRPILFVNEQGKTG